MSEQQGQTKEWSTGQWLITLFVLYVAADKYGWLK